MQTWTHTWFWRTEAFRLKSHFSRKLNSFMASRHLMLFCHNSLQDYLHINESASSSHAHLEYIIMLNKAMALLFIAGFIWWVDCYRAESNFLFCVHSFFSLRLFFSLPFRLVDKNTGKPFKQVSKEETKYLFSKRTILNFATNGCSPTLWFSAKIYTHHIFIPDFLHF